MIVVCGALHAPLVLVAALAFFDVAPIGAAELFCGALRTWSPPFVCYQ